MAAMTKATGGDAVRQRETARISRGTVAGWRSDYRVRPEACKIRNIWTAKSWTWTSWCDSPTSMNCQVPYLDPESNKAWTMRTALIWHQRPTNACFSFLSHGPQWLILQSLEIFRGRMFTWPKKLLYKCALCIEARVKQKPPKRRRPLEHVRAADVEAPHGPWQAQQGGDKQQMSAKVKSESSVCSPYKPTSRVTMLVIVDISLTKLGLRVNSYNSFKNPQGQYSALVFYLSYSFAVVDTDVQIWVAFSALFQLIPFLLHVSQ